MNEDVFLIFGLGFFLFCAGFCIFIATAKEREHYRRHIMEAREFGFKGKYQHPDYPSKEK